MNSSARSLMLLEAVILDSGRSSVAALARQAGIPVASAHRHVAALVRANYLVPAGYGRHLAGPKMRMLAELVDTRQIITNAAAPILDRLAALTGCVIQLGTLDNEMVTYRLKAGESAGDLFTKVGMQLEAYCSAIGKVLLAHLPASDQAAYLATGPFIALTGRTITDPALLKAELDRVAEQGFALDDEEVVTGLQCIAVPIRTAQGDVLAALSASRATGQGPGRDRLLTALEAAAHAISLRTC